MTNSTIERGNDNFMKQKNSELQAKNKSAEREATD